MKEQFKGKQFKQGSYSSVLIVIVIAIIVVINMAASQLPSQYAKLDITDNKLYSIGEQTKTLLGSLNKDVEIYFICQDGKEDENITRMLDLYKDTSSHEQLRTLFRPHHGYLWRPLLFLSLQLP